MSPTSPPPMPPATAPTAALSVFPGKKSPPTPPTITPPNPPISEARPMTRSARPGLGLRAPHPGHTAEPGATGEYSQCGHFPIRIGLSPFANVLGKHVEHPVAFDEDEVLRAALVRHEYGNRTRGIGRIEDDVQRGRVPLLRPCGRKVRAEGRSDGLNEQTTLRVRSCGQDGPHFVRHNRHPSKSSTGCESFPGSAGLDGQIRHRPSSGDGVP